MGTLLLSRYRNFEPGILSRGASLCFAEHTIYSFIYVYTLPQNQLFFQSCNEEKYVVIRIKEVV